MNILEQSTKSHSILNKPQKLWCIYDFIAGFISIYCGIFFSPWQTLNIDINILHLAVIYGLVVFIFSRLLDLPASGSANSSGLYEIIVFSLMTAMLGYMLIAMGVVFFTYEIPGRYIISLTVFSTTFFLAMPRILCNYYLPQKRSRVAIFGTGKLADNMYNRLCNNRRFTPVVFWDCNSTEILKENLTVAKWRNLEEAKEELGKLDIDIVAICVDDDEPIDKDFQSLLFDLPLYGFYVLNKGAFVETYFQEISTDYICFHWTTSFFALAASQQTFILKRVLDIVVSCIGLALTLPFYPLIALVIKLESRGSVFYKQQRVGYLGSIFNIYKFRSMTMNAEKDGAQWASVNDMRTTKTGKLLRLTRVDELPQLWNVLIGEMSLVGPRPERPEFVKELMLDIPFYERRHLVPPGLTGWAQISYRYGASTEDAKKKLQFDLYYIKHLSLTMDFKILLKTIPMIAKGSR